MVREKIYDYMPNTIKIKTFFIMKLFPVPVDGPLVSSGIHNNKVLLQPRNADSSLQCVVMKIGSRL